MISEDRLQKALTFLAETDELSANLKAQMLRREYVSDLARKRAFLGAEGNNEERKAIAEVSQPVMAACGDYFDSVGEFEKLKAKRATEELIVEVWRTLSANRRQGGQI